MQELQEIFGISRYHLVKHLKEINASPLGEKKNYVDGKRTRGVGKVVYARHVLTQLKEFLSTTTDVQAIKNMARAILGDQNE
jgi:hypothetical protein